MSYSSAILIVKENMMLDINEFLNKLLSNIYWTQRL